MKTLIFKPQMILQTKWACSCDSKQDRALHKANDKEGVVGALHCSPSYLVEALLSKETEIPTLHLKIKVRPPNIFAPEFTHGLHTNTYTPIILKYLLPIN